MAFVPISLERQSDSLCTPVPVQFIAIATLDLRGASLIESHVNCGRTQDACTSSRLTRSWNRICWPGAIRKSRVLDSIALTRLHNTLTDGDLVKSHYAAERLLGYLWPRYLALLWEYVFSSGAELQGLQCKASAQQLP